MEDVEAKSKSILHSAISAQASDIHFIPRKKETAIYFRVNSRILLKECVSRLTAEKLISHFKFITGMDIGERRKPQNSAMEFKWKNKTTYLRFSTLPTHSQESLAIRLLPQNESFSLSQLSLFPKVTKQLTSLLTVASGLFITTGPTGAGKTTTLYALLHALKEREMRNIITLEEPVEKKTDDFVQVEVNEKAGITYLEGLKAILRHDPDIIMIGEIRDVETAKLAIRASLTGHLVLTSMHTKNALGALIRLHEFGIPLHEIEQTLIGVTAQRLVEKCCPLCGDCCREYCSFHQQAKRTAVFDVLVGKKLQQAIQSLSKITKGTFKEVKSRQLLLSIRMGYALGYITQRSLERWVGEAIE